MSVNDPFVMQEWAKSFEENDIGFIADSYGDFLNEIDAIIDLTSNWSRKTFIKIFNDY